jgi:hypothetical protein
MNHFLTVDYKKDRRLEEIFKKIASRNTYLFLGAGASVTQEHRFLSSDIIEFYEDKKGIEWGINDIVEFVETLTSHPDYSRDEFDNYVDECLRKYKVSVSHKTVVRLNWRQIITTNYDLLIENAYQEIIDTPNQNLKLYPIRHKNDYYYNPANDELKYVKLNGCISNKKKYKLVFTNDDFQKSNKFYRMVLNDLKNMSDQISFLAIGYSFKDPFARLLLEKFDKQSFRDKRWLYSVDPYVNDASLPYFTQKRICVIKCTMEHFFNEYNKWESENLGFVNSARKSSFTNHSSSKIIIPQNVSVRLYGNIQQLDVNYKLGNITDAQFYLGEEPDYTVILKQFDVIRNNRLNEIVDYLNKEKLDEGSRLIPTIFLTGTFGSGKSTFAYRLIEKLNNDSSTTTLSFELINPSEIKFFDLKELIDRSQAQRIILYVDTIDLNSVFTSLIDLRHSLSRDKTSEAEIIIIATVRENILETYKYQRSIKNSFEIPVSGRLTKEEAEDFAIKLKNSGLLEFRDIQERNAIVDKILSKYDGDSYVTLLELITGGKHIDDLLHAYFQLSRVGQTSFIYTSFLYQYKIPMPIGLLKSLLSMDWDEFNEKVVSILIQKEVFSSGTNPDFHFVTKHPLISRHLIEQIVKNPDRKFEYYQNIIRHIITGYQNSTLVVDLFKAIRNYKDLEDSQLNLLFDEADKQLNEDPHFLLHYAMNLEARRDESSLLKGINKIIYAESISEKRNHRLIHRRGVLTFALARLYNEEKVNTPEEFKIYKLINEARDLFDIKRRLDPCSSFSFYNAIKLELWVTEKFDLEAEELLQTKIRIEELLDTATRAVSDDLNGILELKNKYISKYQFNENRKEYLEFLEDYYQDSKTRPYALVLLFNFNLDHDDLNSCEALLPELELLTHIKDVLRLLFKFYGMFLHFTDFRIKFFDLIKSHPELEDMDQLRYFYFWYIAESYNLNFPYAQELLQQIEGRINFLNPDFNREWIDSESEIARIFEGTLKVNAKGRKQLYIPELSSYFYLDKVKNDFELNTKYFCSLHFFLHGTRAKILNKV